MFICQGCAKDKDQFMYLFRSKGPCEVCHYTDVCVDVKGVEIDPKWKENLKRDLIKAGLEVPAKYQ